MLFAEQRGGNFAFAEAAKTVMQLRVATYNIHKGTLGVGAKKRLRIHDLALGIQALDADIVFLQEVQHLHKRHATQFTQWPAQSQSEFLAEPLGYYSAYETNAVTRHGEHGNALLSRYEIRSIAHNDMSDHRFEQRGLLHVLLNIKRKKLHCIVLHLGLFGGSRMRQMKQVHDYIAAHIPAYEPVIVAGDFNDWRKRIAAVQVGAGFVNAAHHTSATFPARLPVLALDRIYARGLNPAKLADNSLPATIQWRELSDHSPLVTTLLF
jgi:endonuclease/exonuclease/phosphatase family metal-dependent hydrolase